MESSSNVVVIRTRNLDYKDKTTLTEQNKRNVRIFEDILKARGGDTADAVIVSLGGGCDDDRGEVQFVSMAGPQGPPGERGERGPSPKTWVFEVENRDGGPLIFTPPQTTTTLLSTSFPNASSTFPVTTTLRIQTQVFLSPSAPPFASSSPLSSSPLPNIELTYDDNTILSAPLTTTTALPDSFITVAATPAATPAFTTTNPPHLNLNVVVAASAAAALMTAPFSVVIARLVITELDPSTTTFTKFYFTSSDLKHQSTLNQEESAPSQTLSEIQDQTQQPNLLSPVAVTETPPVDQLAEGEAKQIDHLEAKQMQPPPFAVGLPPLVEDD